MKRRSLRHEQAQAALALALATWDGSEVELLGDHHLAARLFREAAGRSLDLADRDFLLAWAGTFEKRAGLAREG